MELISQSYFKLIHKKEQSEHTFRYGIFIDWFDNDSEKVALYHYNGFVVQVFYCKDKNEILRLEAIDEIEAADKYVQLETILK